MSDASSFGVAPASILSAPLRDEADLLGRLEALRGELVELAFSMELRGHIDAADVASGTAARIGELCAEFAPCPAFDPVQAEGGNNRATASRR